MVQLKRDPYVLGLAAILVIAGGALIYFGKLTPKEAEMFFVGYILPSIVGRKEGSDAS